jgi:hypothetical protein
MLLTVSHANIRLGCESLALTNSQAYLYDMPDTGCCLTPGKNVIKLFKAIIY